MAVAAVIPAMRLTEPKPVHPFFDRSQRSSALLSQANTTSKGRSGGKSNNNARRQDAEDTTEGPNSSAESCGQRSKRRKKPDKTHAERTEDGTDDGAGATGRDSGAVVESLQLGPMHDLGRKQPHFDARPTADISVADPNIHRRKRRRITSSTRDNHKTLPTSSTLRDNEAAIDGPSEPPSWLHQLQLHASRVQLDPNDSDVARNSNARGQSAVSLVRNTNSIKPALSHGLDKEGRSTLPSNVDNIHVSSELQSSSATHNSLLSAEVTVSPRATTPSAASTQDSVVQQAPEKKMLRVRSNGRLSSPVCKQREDSTSASEIRRKPGRPRKTQVKPVSLIVTIKYGTDPLIRASIAQRIEQIIAGVSYTPAIVIKQTKVGPSSPKPRKPTHPFFLAKSTQESDRTMKDSEDSVRNEIENVRAKLSSPRKSAVTPGKLRSQAQRASCSQLPTEHESPNKGKIHGGLGGLEAPWPTSENVHIRGTAYGGLIHAIPTRDICGRRCSDRRKLKGTSVSVTDEEDLLSLTCRRLHMHIPSVGTGQAGFKPVPESLRVPQRQISSGPDLQELVRTQVRARLPPPATLSSNAARAGAECVSTEVAPGTHSAIHHLYRGISNTMTAFDKGQCEIQGWAQKYAPRSAADVLQTGREVIILRDWLSGLTVSQVEGSISNPDPKELGSKTGKSDPRRCETRRPRKKRRKRAGELDGFIVSSDEEAYDMEPITDAEDKGSADAVYGSAVKSIIRPGHLSMESGAAIGKKTNTVLVSGPCGCGKSAAVYAVAKDLGFEVFEINPSGRRSGKDILDRVGEMTQNHLVHQEKSDPAATAAADDLARLEADFQKDLDSGRQGTMNSFFKPTNRKKAKPIAKVGYSKPLKDERKDVQKKQPQRQKQSLILLEEVDILFEEDKQFWMTVLSLCSISKRPIIMTCNDESLVPLGALELYAILRFSPPPADLATDYLLLMAANEGHVLARDSVSALYAAKGNDLRATIMELDFWCQIGVGAEKGGWDWMLQRWPPGIDINDDGHTIRVASKDTYHRAMGWYGRDLILDSSINQSVKEEELLLESWKEWRLDIQDLHGFEQPTDTSVGANVTDVDPAMSNVETLRRLEKHLDACSAVDVFARVGLPSGIRDIMDRSHPATSEKARLSYIEGLPLLEATPLDDYSEFDTRISVAMHRLQKGVLYDQDECVRSPENNPCPLSTIENTIITGIIDRHETARCNPQIGRSDFSAAFDPISEASTSAPSGSSHSDLHVSSFDRPFSIVVTDLAPYVRSIVSYDLSLEARRLRLSNLLSEGVRDGKRARTTRASRSALEGGSRETTRRERWFGKDLNAALVLRTGGGQWQSVGPESALQGGENANGGGASRRSSVGSVDELGMRKA